MANYNEKDKSPLLKFRSVAKVDPVTKKHWQVGLVLRENGRFEVYADFILVSMHLESKCQCVDIETDFNQFFLKFVVYPDLVNCTTEPKELEINSKRTKQSGKKHDKSVPRYEIR